MQSLDEEVDALAHEHVFLGERHEENARRTLWVVALTAVMMVGEIIAGLIFNSMVLLADGIHTATHAGGVGGCSRRICVCKASCQQSTVHVWKGRIKLGYILE